MPVPTNNLQLACPSCGEARCWQPWVDGNSFIGRCGKCPCRWRSPLPEVSPKVIVLDTNVLSDITKLRMPDFAADRKAKLEHWAGVVARMEAADALQAIICPQTPTLDRERELTKYGPAIVEVARGLSHGVSFPQRHVLEAQQLYNAVIASRKNEPVASVSRGIVFNGEVDHWRSPFQISVDLGYHNDPDEVRSAKERLHSNADKVFQDWATTTQSRDQIFQKELRAFGPAMLKKFGRYCLGMEHTLDPIGHTVNVVRMALVETGVSDADMLSEIESFMLSEAASMIPTNRISAALYASVARKVAGGTKSPEPSFWLDVEMLSAVLPYCDAILIEGQFAGALKEVKKYLPAECQQVPVFSVRELPAFVSYLDDLIAAVPADQRAAAEALYLGKRG